MKEFRAHYSRWRMALLLAACLGFVAIGLWMAGVVGEGPDPSGGSRRIPPELVPYVGWLCAIFFGAGLPIIAKRFFDDRAQVEIGRAGIRVRQWSDAVIPWDEIKAVSVWSYQRQRHIILHLHRPEAFPGRGIAAKLSRANRMLTGGDIAINLVGTDGRFDDAMAAIAHFGGRALFD
jgi:hypothetical protein